MSSEEPTQTQDVQQNDVPMQEAEPPTAPAAMSTANKKRPRLDLGVGRERKRGKTMFGILLGTLNKAKVEEKEKSASEAAKKRQLLEQRLQAKLRKETDSVRRAEEAKKDKMSANRKEEELQLKDSIHKLRRTRLPLLANFLCTSDEIPENDTSPPSTDPLSTAPRSHPPPIYYLPAVLLSSQEAYLNRRKAEVKEAVEKEWSEFREERQQGIEEINQLRQRVVDEEVRQKSLKEKIQDEATDVDKDVEMAPASSDRPNEAEPAKDADAAMDVEDTGASGGGGGGVGPEKDKVSTGQTATQETKETSERRDEPAPMQADDEDAVEY